MGGSGGGGGSSDYSSPGRTSANTTGMPPGRGGGIVGQDPCPAVVTAVLIDVAQTGNGAVASSLTEGSPLVLAENGNVIEISSNGQTIGWLPNDLSQKIKRCIDDGKQYEASIRSVSGQAPAPRVEVTLKRL